ncbi:transglutaminase-like domain-containing protein [Flavobacterium capsici]|uniref:Transglutaminase-like domain-containing protein n=1 Tax=Flavobacterium capsici TaxID=3075618 RepID=A0AA96EZD3_9FLAO|nr:MULTISPECIES: transglutaminase-like domain-containing protein [unclassified Flavobacterium]WNM19705.1 transglutaminase-like domain-containing protein [Flavobacterium sp. PMR2A8]WNM21094.1 transglutaminase-like domain-containing protein [Flavobacterium sp. PMTSA4]
MKTTFYSLVFLLFFASNSYAQKGLDPTADEISQAKKLREKYSKDDIAILESSDFVSFDLNKKAGKVIVNHSIKEHLMNINHRADIQKYEFYDSESSIQSFSLKYRNDKTASFSVKDEFYKDRDLFYNDAKVKYINVDFPVQGYNYKYEMEKKYDDVKYFTSLFFNDEYPVLNKKITFEIPNWLEIELKEFNFDGFKINKTSKTEDKKTIITYTLENVPAAFKESDAPGRSYLYPHILVIAKSFSKDGNSTTLFKTNNDLYKWYVSLIQLMKDNTSVMKSKVTELTANAKTDEEKIKNIYYWVQDNIRYIAFEDGIAGFKPDESNNVFEKRYGDCKGMANLIKQMLKLAGFDARLTWIGTKHIAYDYNTPSLAVDNHMICTLMYKGKKIFLDGTEKYNSYGEYAERIQNKEVMIEDGDKCIIEKVPSVTADFNKESFKSSLSIEGETLKGTCNKTFQGESRAEFLNIYNSFETTKRKERLDGYLSKQNKSITVSDVKTSDLKNRDIKLTVDYNIAIQNRVSSFDDEIYIDLDFMNEFKNFDLKDRKVDYEMSYKTNYVSQVNLKIPDGYKVIKMPENLSVKEANFDINLSFENAGKEIIYKKSFVFKNGCIKANEIEKWNDFVKKLVENYNQQITLSK